MKSKEIILVIFIFAVVVSSVLWSIRLDTQAHEIVHKKIYQDYGFDCNITVDLLGGSGECYGANLTGVSEEDRRFIKLAHEMNEVVAYNFGGMKFYVGIMLLLQAYLIVALVFREEE